MNNLDNLEALSDDELKAIIKLQKLAKTWPRSLTLASMGGSLVVVKTSDPRFDEWEAVKRNEAIIAVIDGIPNTGGDW